MSKQASAKKRSSKPKKEKTPKKRTRLDRILELGSRQRKYYAPPEKLTVTEWADRRRILSTENSSEAGRWRTSRTPYLEEVMNAFSDPQIELIVFVGGAQVGKSESMNNMIGCMIDNYPGSAKLIMPGIDVVRDYSVRRLAPMIRDTKVLRDKVSDVKSRDSSNTIMRKTYPGGMLTLAGSNSAASLASIPARFIFGDEVDRWAGSAGTEGDPWKLVSARTITFYNRKRVAVSTPTIKGASKIAELFEEGTMETWQHKCPECGAFHQIRFADIRWESERIEIASKIDWIIKDINYTCPECGSAISEDAMRKAPTRWVSENPKARERGARSFWMNGLSSPWLRWEDIIREFLQAGHDQAKLQAVINTKFGELFENRGDIEDPDLLMYRREEYDADLPDGVLVLTCGVDTQDDRLEYEVVGHGMYGETYGIKRGVILGRPESGGEVWEQLDSVLDRTYYFAGGEKGLIIALTCVDSGGHYTQDVYYECAKRLPKKVFAIKGKGGDGVPYIAPKPSKVQIRRAGRIIGQAWLYIVGVDSGKAKIMGALKVQESGPKYCHFPSNDGLGYEATYFNGLVSERPMLARSGGRDVWRWEKIPGHERNEALDCFDSETQVLTNGGWRYFRDLQGESLATVNLDSGEIEYQYSEGYVSRRYNGKMLELKGRRIDILVTPKHRMVTYKKKQRSDETTGKRRWVFDVAPEITLAEDLTIHHQLMVAANWTGCDEDVVIKASISRQGRVIQSEAIVSARVMASFLGWYVAEGNRSHQVSKTQGNARYRVQITQNEGQKADEIRRTLSQLPWKYHEYLDRGRSIKFLILSKQAYDFVGQCGDGCYNKRVPKMIKDGSPDIIKAFLDAAIAGDGWTQQKSNQREFRTYATTSRLLADDIQELFIKTGCASNIKVRDELPPFSIKGRDGETSTQYHVTECKVKKASLDGGGNGKREFIGKWIDYDGMVYCATVPNGTLVCRRNGKSFIAGNCRNYANAAFSILSPDMDHEKSKVLGAVRKKAETPPARPRTNRKRNSYLDGGDL